MDGLLGQSDGLIRLRGVCRRVPPHGGNRAPSPEAAAQRLKARRWLTNLGIAGVDTLVLRLMAALAVPVAAVAAAFFARSGGSACSIRSTGLIGSSS